MGWATQCRRGDMTIMSYGTCGRLYGYLGLKPSIHIDGVAGEPFFYIPGGQGLIQHSDLGPQTLFHVSFSTPRRRATDVRMSRAEGSYDLLASRFPLLPLNKSPRQTTHFWQQRNS
jgi:hypothetical protein